MMSWMGNESENQSSARDDEDNIIEKDEAIKRLLLFCKMKNFAIPESIKELLDPMNEIPDVVTERKHNLSRVESPSSILESQISKNKKLRNNLEEHDITKEVRRVMDEINTQYHHYELRVKDGRYKMNQTIQPQKEGGGSHIPTVVNNNQKTIFHKMKQFLETGNSAPKMKEKVIMSDINLRLQSGKMYLVLGLPGSGKSTLLKYIANRLTRDENNFVEGKLSINGVFRDQKDVVWTNLTGYIDQIDRVHPLLTVWETCLFAFNCRRNGTHRTTLTPTENPDINKKIEELDKEVWKVNRVLEALGLTRVKDTFVGNEKVRGVSGGERKRVTVGEMLCSGAPILCMDEISTGLDAATTYDIVRILSEVSRFTNTIKIISLLQPPPETVALFDEIILIDNGQILFTGPLDSIVPYFTDIGYHLPARMDVADWLLSLPKKDGAKFRIDEDKAHLSSNEFYTAFWSSDRGKLLLQLVEEPLEFHLKELKVTKDITDKYHTSLYTSLKLVLQREVLLWWRNKYQRKARLIQDVVVGVVVGTVFWQSADDNPDSVVGVLFQSLFFISLGTMVKIPEQVETRGVFYKQQDANYYPAWAYIFGRSMAALPTSIVDALIYGSLVYWCVGLAASSGAPFYNYLIFLLLVLVAAFSFGLTFSFFSTVCKDRPTTQACMSLSIVFLVMFSGFTVQPDVIPNYWIWAYWINLLAWMLRSLILNQFLSGAYDTIQPDGRTIGENILSRFGFVRSNGEPFTYAWVWYGLLFTILFGVIATLGSVYALNNVRFATGKALQGAVTKKNPEEQEVEEKIEFEKCDTELQVDERQIQSNKTIDLPFTRVDLTFTKIHYYVKASTQKEILELLKGIDGYFLAGKMTALMGSSGAGKTTLMDVLSLRKTSGTVEGEVKLNGHLQNKNTFRRCSGYVEQFDVQSPQLTVRETVEFSAKMRLDVENISLETLEQFVNQTLEMLELSTIHEHLVGSDISGGLSFEQRKRLSIAVELVANPSIIFLDEPTSGLDARAASIVMRGLKRIAESGRTVCATIHQPSQAIFYSFDYLLLLKRGGEAVFFDELGDHSSNLIDYLESYSTTTPIQDNENPATWMLTCIAGGSSSSTEEDFDYAKAYLYSDSRKACMETINELDKDPSLAKMVTYPKKFARSSKSQRREVLRRMFKIYWRSPSYNRTRILMNIVIAFLFGSVFASQRTPASEADMNSRLTSLYITSVFMGVYSFNTVLSVFEVERNMFYRHKFSLMYAYFPLIFAVTIVELPFILVSGLLFSVFFYFMVGFSTVAYRFFLYYLFFTLNMACWTFLGQAFMSLFKDVATAQGFGSVMATMNSLFSGVLIRPQNISSFWLFSKFLLYSPLSIER